MKRKLAIVAIGGNSLIKDGKTTFEDQMKACQETARNIIKLREHGYRIAITHGNGPQVGFILRRCELAADTVHSLPLDACVAQSQGQIGYAIQSAMNEVLEKEGYDFKAVTILTRVLVDKNDSSFKNPTKPIGPHMDKKAALKFQKENSWDIVEDAGRGYRRVVPSPKPIEIIELEAIRETIKHDIVIAVGGGGIPVILNQHGKYKGVEAVIDKDLASAVLAKSLRADLLLISTAVEMVSINFGKPNEKKLKQITVAEAEKYIKEGYFATGSMLPKIEAVVDFVKSTGKIGIITSPEKISESLDGKTGTFVIP